MLSINSLKFNKIKQKYDKNPLFFIIIIALLPRILAAIFSKGYAMHDDMFGPVQSMQEMLNDFATVQRGEPRLIIYPLVQYVIFAISEFFGIFSPQTKILFVRIFHSIYSLLTVVLGYKITALISNEKNARTVGIILALLWFLPFMSVHNLVEVFSIPPLLAGVFYILKYLKYNKNELISNNLSQKSENKLLENKYLFLSGLFFAFAFVIRIQSAFVPIGIGTVMLFQRQFKPLFVLTFSTLIITIILLGIPEYLFWGKPLQSILFYLRLDHNSGYPQSPWYMTFLLIIGVLIPPMGIMLFYGYFRTFRKYILLFAPVFLFIIFHSIFPNKQERFILTIIPLLIILCIIGWNEFAEKSIWWQKHRKLLKINWIWFWIINSILLIIFIFSYSKRTRVESFTYLSEKKISGIVLEMNESNKYFAPTFYLGKNNSKPIYELYKDYSKDEFVQIFSQKTPNYAIFFDENDLDERINLFENNFYCKLDFQEEISPGLLDKILHFTNPKHNRNYTAFIYKIKY